jgi:hypothetical protein
MGLGVKWRPKVWLVLQISLIDKFVNWRKHNISALSLVIKGPILNNNNNNKIHCIWKGNENKVKFKLSQNLM